MEGGIAGDGGGRWGGKANGGEDGGYGDRGGRIGGTRGIGETDNDNGEYGGGTKHASQARQLAHVHLTVHVFEFVAHHVPQGAIGGRGDGGKVEGGGAEDIDGEGGGVEGGGGEGGGSEGGGSE
eukprot:5892104-Prymnesium_polylepis.1